MKFTLIKWKPLISNYELIDAKSNENYGCLPHPRVIVLLTNACLWLGIYIMLKLVFPHFSAVLFALLVIIEAILRHGVLYMVATLYVNIISRPSYFSQPYKKD